MKVVFLSATGQLGGAERVLICLMKALRSEKPDWSLQVIAGDDGPLIPFIAGLGFDVEVLSMPPRLVSMGEASAGNPIALIRAFVGAFQYRNQLRTLLAKRQADVIHSLNFKMHLLAAYSVPSGSKLCWHIHDFVSNRVLTRKLMRFLSNRPTCVVAISESVARDMRSVSKLPNRVRTVLNAVDLDQFSPNGPRRQPLNQPSVGFIATFARWKGHEVFLRAIAAVPFPVHAYLVGGAVYRTAGSQVTVEELQALTEELKLSNRVTFTGFLEDTAPLLRSLDVVVHASTEREPFGLTVAEAMACGCAVVASLAGGVTEILEDKTNGLGHSPGDVEELAAAITKLLHNPELRTQYGRAARLTAEAKLDPRRMAQQFIETYRDC